MKNNRIYPMIIIALFAIGCAESVKPIRPYPATGSENINVLVKKAPKNTCKFISQSSGLARDKGTVETVWGKAIIDIRNKALKKGGDTVVITKYDAIQKGNLIEVNVIGHIYLCRGAKKLPHKPKNSTTPTLPQQNRYPNQQNSQQDNTLSPQDNDIIPPPPADKPIIINGDE